MLWIITQAFLATSFVSGENKTYASIAVNPKTVALGDSVTITSWIIPLPPYDGREGYKGYVFNITKPNGVVDTVIKDSYGDATATFVYPCDQLGVWQVFFHWDGDNDHEAATSPTVTWNVVREIPPPEPIVPPKDQPIPRPLNSGTREYWEISGPWPGGGSFSSYNASGVNFNPYTLGPTTSHILWKKQTNLGGLIGGGKAGSFKPEGVEPIVVAGRVFYLSSGSLVCLDQYTGETIFEVPVDADDLIFSEFDEGKVAPVLRYYSHLYTSNRSDISAFDPWTGDLAWTLRYNGTVGEGYWELGKRAWMTHANHALYVSFAPGTLYKLDLTKRVTSTTKFVDIVAWSVQTPIDPPDQNNPAMPLVGDGVVLTYWMSGLQQIAFDEETGEQLWNQTLDRRTNSWGCIAYGKWMSAFSDGSFRAYDVHTGQLLWKTEETVHPWGEFSAFGVASGYGKVYCGTYDGYFRCYDVEDGKLLWEYYSGDTIETMFGTFPFWGTPVVGDGKVYVATGEHSAPNPVPKGDKLYCFDVNDGKILWELENFRGAPYASALADGIFFASNLNDGCLYAFSKGETTTEITVTQSGSIPEEVLIQGRVTDQSPADVGAPASNINVHLTATTQEGTEIEIGNATTNTYGLFQYVWAIPDPGSYIISATSNSEAYWSSTGATSFHLFRTPSQSLLTNLNLAIAIAIIVAAIILVYALLSVRRTEKK
ncbi:PQQ-binding-like beta-propeller repeat protein [Candidatus Bathyarchaeota archaeon]|nr:PQQ-binding-like beta-propeller repeat protein [Candidatus Bathyarchaeota archaeon]